MSSSTLRVCALYPELMNIYADRGNLLMLERRCAWRGIGFQLTATTLEQQLRDEHDLYYIGGGQDADQLRCAEDLVHCKAPALRAAAGRGAIVLGVCGGYQLLGHHYEIADERIEGVGLLDVVTIRADGERLIGNIVVELEPPLRGAPRDGGEPGERLVVGFENHAGRTQLGAGQAPFARVVRGRGNDGHSGFEGARAGNVIGTYVHGPLLPKNAWLCDWLIARALGLEPDELAALDDTLEDAAHANALHAAGA
jgi:CobQ-like glutamine amidotransferase family enzyme